MAKIKCLLCGDLLVGDKKGTFLQCRCGNVYIDETEYYCRIGFKEKEKYKVFGDKEKKQKKEKLKKYEKRSVNEKSKSFRFKRENNKRI